MTMYPPYPGAQRGHDVPPGTYDADVVRSRHTRSQRGTPAPGSLGATLTTVRPKNMLNCDRRTQCYLRRNF